jgi:hypothetical protein
MGHAVSKSSFTVVDGEEAVLVKRKWVKKIPASLFKVDSVKSFNMSHNVIIAIPPQISQLRNLTELNLSHNWLTNKGIPAELAQLTSLRVLDLSINTLSTVPIEICSLTKLHTLNLGKNTITTIPQELTKLVNLKSLNFKNNKIEVIPDLESLPSLFILDLSHNQIKVIPKSLKQITTLRMLQLSHNHLARIPSFRQLTNLVHLDVHNNRLSKISPKMAYIVDSNTSKTREGAPTTFGKLRELNVRENKDLLELPQELVDLLRPPLMLHTSIPSEIDKNLYLGGLDCATNMQLLQHLNITHIVLAIGEMQPHFPKNFSYLPLHDAKDSPNFDFSVYFNECSNFIDSAKANGGSVLVHCRAGVSRSPTIMVAYMMKKHRMRYEEAMQVVTSKRSQTLPNNGFREQLMQYEVKLFEMSPGDNFGFVNESPRPHYGGADYGKTKDEDEKNVIVAAGTP